MSGPNLDEAFSNAIDHILRSSLPNVLQGCNVDDLITVVGFLRHTLYPSIDPYFVSGALTLRLAGDTDPVRGVLTDDLTGFIGRQYENLAFELRRSGRLYFLGENQISASAESQAALVYQYSNKEDRFFVAGIPYTLPSLNRGADSQFCGTTFFSLTEAIDEYAKYRARSCECFILKTAWYDNNRCFFRSAPESILRNSLKQFLSDRLAGGYSVELEQNVDGSHPVDIRVVKELIPRMMLIEVKWLGDSVNEEGAASNVSYRDQRAIDGANQLGSYIESQKSQTPHLGLMGYYVVFDGRRSGLSFGKEDYTREQLFHFENVETKYGDLEVFKRDDFAPPHRLFIGPVRGVVRSRAGKK